MPIEFGTLNQAHDCSRTLTDSQRSRKQRIVSPNGYWQDLVFNPVIVDRQLPVIEKSRECSPAREALIQCFGNSRPIGDLLALQLHPLVHGIDQRFGLGLGLGLPDLSSLISVQILDLALHGVKLGDVLQRLICDLALVAHMQVNRACASNGPDILPQ